MDEMKQLLRSLKRYLIPHRRNRYKPQIFSRQSVGALVLCLLLIEGIYLIQIHVVLKNNGFLAAVLPAAITSLTNADRSSQGLSSLTEDPLLAQAAQAKANDMAAKGYFSHVSPDGKTPWYWFDSVKYPYSYAGENLAVDFTDSQDVETAWMNSPMHRANILKAQYTRIGIGIAQGMYQGKETTFVVQFFATRAEDSSAAAAAVVSNASVATVPATALATTVNPKAAVLGSETVPPKKPVTAVKAVKTAAAPVTTVASEQTTAHSAPAPARVAVAVTSPTHFILYLLSALIGFFLMILLITLAVHARKRFVYMEVLTGGFVLVGVVVLMLVYDQSALPRVPSSSEAASAAIAL
ncbi:MAG: hypothetical protein JWM46_374 [Candidatus Kaiserbacteria bacterium]|nr:hypothetical protein [Candidatus Kaiserbacteria bacterium]